MRTKEKSKRATYAKIKRKHPHSRSKNIRQEKHSKHSRHLRQICIKCTLCAAAFTLTLTATANWQILKTRMNNWKDFSAEATTLLMSRADADLNTRHLPIQPNISDDSVRSDSAVYSADAEPKEDFEPSEDTKPSDSTEGSSNESDPDRSSDFSDTSDFYDAASPSDTAEFYERTGTSEFIGTLRNSESSGISDSEFLRRNHLSDPAEDSEAVNHISSVSDEWNLVLVNPWNPIPDNYDISLAALPNGHFIDQRCYSALMEMLDDCRSVGLSPLICSSYRTQEKQESLFSERMDELTAEGYSQKEARKKAATSVALPGTSEHQIGLSVDLVDSSYQYLNSSQENTAVQQWLMENSWKYGFILRYPSEKSSLTGIIYEPWHYRYVGREAAKEIYDRGICLEEYLEEEYL